MKTQSDRAAKPAYRGKPVRRGARTAPAAKPAVPVVSPARKTAFTVLRDVYQNGAYASLALNRRLSEDALKDEDRRLCTLLVYGVIENAGLLDYKLDQLMDKPTQQPVQRIILRMGAYQILFLERVPDSAAVNESVNQCRLCGMDAAAGFVNGVLRQLAREKETLRGPEKEPDTAGYLSVMGSVPRWLCERLIADYGPEDAERMLLKPGGGAGVTVRPTLSRQSEKQFEAWLTEKGWKYEKSVVPGAYKLNGANAAQSHEYAMGLFSIQGQSSMLAAMAMDAKPGQKLLDACAAPGGKAAFLCEKLEGTGRVYAWELHESRSALLEGTRRRLHLDNLRIMTRDAASVRADWEQTLDGVLLDAPCSGTGVMQQKPDLKNRLREEDPAALAETQRVLLNAVCGYVKRGGTLVYSTCSVLKDENERQIARFLADHPEFEMKLLPQRFPQQVAELCGPYGLQLMPGQLGLEGFFIASMRRVR